MINVLRILLVMVFLVSCSEDPISETGTDNPNIKIDLLFNHNGCSVYRFRDGGYSRYFSDCSGSISSRVYCGKTCTRPNTTINMGQ